jgi:hypothetical protein
MTALDQSTAEVTATEFSGRGPRRRLVGRRRLREDHGGEGNEPCGWTHFPDPSEILPTLFRDPSETWVRSPPYTPQPGRGLGSLEGFPPVFTASVRQLGLDGAPCRHHEGMAQAIDRASYMAGGRDHQHHLRRRHDDDN